MENKEAKICSNALKNIANDASDPSPANEESQPSGIDSNKSGPDVTDEKVFITWENESNSCWLDSSLSLLAHNQTMRNVISVNPDAQVSKAIKSFDKAISTLNDTSSNKPLEERMALAKSILQQSQESCLNYLQPLVKFQKGEPDSAFCALLNLIKEDKVIQGYFEVTFTWVRYCDHCETQRVLTVTKPIITVARVEVFVPEDLVLPYQCQVCKKSDQKMKLLYKKLPECLIYHFEKGAGKGEDLPLKFAVASRDYALTSVMMLEKGQESDVNHFVSYIRDPQNGRWLECNDLNPEIVTFTELQASFNLEDVFMYVFEACDDLGTVKIEGEPTLIYASHSIPCIDLSDEEDKASPKKNAKGENTESKADEDAETVENVRKFLLTSSVQDPVSEDRSGSECPNEPDSTTEVEKSVESQNVVPNISHASQLVKQDTSKIDNEAKKLEVNLPTKGVSIPVKGFDVEKFVEQKLSELATNQKASPMLRLKTKANNLSPVTTVKVKGNASFVKTRRGRKVEDLDNVTVAENLVGSMESSQSSKAFSTDKDSLALMENELTNSSVHHGEKFNDTLSSDDNENYKFSTSDTESLNEEIDFSWKKDTKTDKLISIKPAIKTKSDKKYTQFGGDVSKQVPASIFSKKSKSQQSSIKAYFSKGNKNNNDSVLKQVDTAFDKDQISNSPKESLAESMMKAKLRKTKSNILKKPMLRSKKHPFQNGYLTEQKSNAVHKDQSNLRKNSSEKDLTVISKNKDHFSLSNSKNVFFEDEHDDENDYNSVLEQLANDDKNPSSSKEPFLQVKTKTSARKIEPKLAIKTMLMSKTDSLEDSQMNEQRSNIKVPKKSVSFDELSTGEITVSSSNSEVVDSNLDLSPGHLQQSNLDYHVTAKCNKYETIGGKAQPARAFKTYSKPNTVSTPNSAKKTRPVHRDCLKDSSEADRDSDNLREIGVPFNSQKPKCVEKSMKVKIRPLRKSKAENQTAEDADDGTVEMADSPVEGPSAHHFDTPATGKGPPLKKFKAEIANGPDEILPKSPFCLNYAAFVRNSPNICIRNSSLSRDVPLGNINSSISVSVKCAGVPNVAAGLQPCKNVPTANSVVQSSSCSAFAENTPDSVCLKPGCQCYKMESEKALDVTVDYFLTQIFQIFPIKTKI